MFRAALLPRVVMRSITSRWLCLALVVATAVAAQQPSLTPSQAKDHIGETATVCGVVASARYAASSRGRPTFLNLDKPYPNQLFTVVIWGEVRPRFSEPPERAFDGKRICVTGRIELYRGAPQITVQEPSAIAAPASP